MPSIAGRPRLELDLDLIVELREGKELGWRQAAREYQRRTGAFVSRDSIKRRYRDYMINTTNRGKRAIIAPNLSASETAYTSKTDSYDTALIRRLRDGGCSWQAIACAYLFKTGRRICHKTAKRVYERSSNGKSRHI